MSKLIALDDGHGMATSGKRTPYIASLGRQIRENEFNREVVKYLDAELKRCGFRTLLTAPTDYDVPLIQRTNLANAKRADLFISIHFNAFDASFGGRNPQGFSAHIDPSGGQSEVFAKIALKHLAKGTKQVNRGVVKQNLHITRETKMPAVLFELGFMDHPDEALLMLKKSFQKECAVEIAKAVCEFYKVKYVSPTPPVQKPKKLVKKGVATMKRDVHVYSRPQFGTQTGKVVKKGEVRNIYEVTRGWYRLYDGSYIPSNYGKNFTYKPVKKTEELTRYYRVVVGSFKKRENAQERLKAVEAKGFKGFLLFHGGHFRVVVGSFRSRSNAESQQKALKAKGFETFLMIEDKS